MVSIREMNGFQYAPASFALCTSKIATDSLFYLVKKEQSSSESEACQEAQQTLRIMAREYAHQQPQGFKNCVENVAIVGVIC